jgi:putative ABC transport system substrate-binding protein
LQAAGGALIAWPIQVRAQKDAKDAKLPLVAVLYPGTEEVFKPRVAAVRGGLKDEGLVEGRDYVLEARFASGDSSQLPRLAKELDSLKPQVFVAPPMQSPQCVSCDPTPRWSLPPSPLTRSP